MRIDTGRIIIKVELKSYPIIKKNGVPNNKRPTPKIDWKVHKRIIMISSKSELIW